jgi:hypothetical protein
MSFHTLDELSTSRRSPQQGCHEASDNITFKGKYTQVKDVEEEFSISPLLHPRVHKRTDPMEHLYAFFRLSAEVCSDPRLAPNYEITITQGFRNLAIWALFPEESLGFLELDRVYDLNRYGMPL